MAGQLNAPAQFPDLPTFQPYVRSGGDPRFRYYRGRRKRGVDPATVVLVISFIGAVAFSGMVIWISLRPEPATSKPLAATPAEVPPVVDEQDNASEAADPTLQDLEDDYEEPENPFISDLAPVAKNRIDDIVFSRLAELEIEPANVCPDAVFLRRVYMDCLGTLPTWQEARTFLDNDSPNKRAQLIEDVLRRPEFADYAAMKWSDILRVKAEFPIKLWPNAAQAYHRWIRESIANNLPYDVFVRELLTESGSNFRKPQVNFFRAVQDKEPKALAQAVALTFLCQRADQWPDHKLEGMSVFFSQVGYKPTGEWKEEIVYFDQFKGRTADQETLKAVFPDGTEVRIPAGQDPREVFADWLLRDDNPMLSEAIANRLWYWLLGRGIVEPADDMRPDNPPANPQLLKYLGEELVANHYDLKHLYRLILNSETYQLSCIPESEHPEAGANFAYYHVRRLDAEVLIDAICQLTGTFERYSSIIPEPFTFLPDGHRAVCLPDGSITSSFLEMFGRPPRDTGMESERNNRLTAAQALHLLNSNHIRNKLKQGPGLNQITNGDGEDYWETTSMERLFLAILSRRPTSDEQVELSSRSYREIAWTLINTDEFLFKH